MFPCLFYVFCFCDSSSWLFLIIVTFLIFFYQSFFGPLLKISLFSRQKIKNIILLFVLVLKKILVILFPGNQFFAIHLFFHAWSRKHFVISVFSISFFVKLFCISLFLSKRKMIDSLYFFSSFFFFFLIRSLFMCPLVMFTLLVVTLPTDKNLVF